MEELPDLNDLGKGNTQDIPVKLGGVNNAKSTLKNRNLLLEQRFTIGKKKVVNTDSTATNKSKDRRIERNIFTYSYN